MVQCHPKLCRISIQHAKLRTWQNECLKKHEVPRSSGRQMPNLREIFQSIPATADSGKRKMPGVQ
jgi:hypothetical protein